MIRPILRPVSGAEGRRTTRAGVITVAAFAAVIALAGTAAIADGVPGSNPYSTAQFVTGLFAVPVGAYLAWHRPRHPIGWLLLVDGIAALLSFFAFGAVGWLIVNAPELEWTARAILRVGVPGWIVSRGVCIALLPQAFWAGFGRDVLARVLLTVSVAAIAVTAVCHSVIWTPEFFQGQPPNGLQQFCLDVQPWADKVTVVAGLVAIVLLVVRLVRAPADEQRRYRWFVGATVVLLAPLVIEAFQNSFSTSITDISSTVEVWVSALLPVVLAVGILRHGLFDLQVVVRRATVYLLVSVIALAIYALAVWVTTTVSDDSSTVAALIGAGLVAVTLSHVRDLVQRLVSRHLFGTRDDARATLAAFGARLEAAPVGDQALQTVCDTICDQLRLPWAAVDLALDDATVQVAATGTPDGHGDGFPLVHQGIALGTLHVGWRTANEPFTASERELLGELARQTGVIAHNVSLTEALRRSRMVLLNAREEERRRIRADLHDGLGPTLATVALGLGAASERLGGDGELPELLRDLEGELQTAIADVRGLVYELRPAQLDDLGLVSALREHAEALARRTADSVRPLTVQVDAPAELGTLPAAVEVAAYRVALEALTNVARHAGASTCRVVIATDDGLTLRVEDDGVGLDGRAATAGHGVGLSSMRERVEELGGRFRIMGSSPRGTTVDAWLPLPAVVA